MPFFNIGATKANENKIKKTNKNLHFRHLHHLLAAVLHPGVAATHASARVAPQGRQLLPLARLRELHGQPGHIHHLLARLPLSLPKDPP